MDQHLPLQGPPKFTQIGIFGLKIYHLATLPFKASTVTENTEMQISRYSV
jgi:hypothetical protein